MDEDKDEFNNDHYTNNNADNDDTDYIDKANDDHHKTINNADNDDADHVIDKANDDDNTGNNDQRDKNDGGNDNENDEDQNDDADHDDFQTDISWLSLIVFAIAMLISFCIYEFWYWCMYNIFGFVKIDDSQGLSEKRPKSILRFSRVILGVLISLITLLIARYPNLVNKYFNIINVIAEYRFEHNAWFLVGYLYSTLFGLFMMELMAIFLFVAKLCAESISEDSSTTIDKNIYFFTVSMSSWYLFFCCYYFTKAVLARFADQVLWGWRPFDEVFLDAISHTFKHHMGTICYNATVFLPPLFAVERLVLMPNDLRTIHEIREEYTNEELITEVGPRLIQYIDMTIFIADYSIIITGCNSKDVLEATDTIYRLLHRYYKYKDDFENDLSLQTFRKVDNLYIKLTFIVSIAYFIVLLLWYAYTGQDICFLEVLLESCYNVMTVIVLPLSLLVYSTIMNTSIIYQWCNEEVLYEVVPVAG